MIEIRNVTKRFGKLVAVNNVSFSVGHGEALALLGSNGAGKSTLIKCMLGLLDYSGNISMNGIDVREHPKEARRCVGYLPQESAFYDMRARDIIWFFARLRNTGGVETDNLLTEVGLAEHASKYASELSGGMRQRLSFAIALLSSPQTLLLDEPTSNLDARARGDFLKLVKEYKDRGKTVVFSSHRLDEVDYLADRVIVMRDGKLIMDEEPEKIRHRLGLGTKMNIAVPEEFVSRASSVLAEAGIIVHGKNGKGLLIEVRGGDSLHPLRELMSRQIPVVGFSVEEPTMENILEGAVRDGA
ncbi:MAG: ATP-binding cassette domain-containing protein [Thermodesulfobacteriota bacterium]